MKPIQIGRTGSRDFVILRLNSWGLYLSVRISPSRRVRIAFGPNYARTFLIT